MYKIYQQYEDNLLRRVLQQLRKSKMISLNKKAKKISRDFQVEEKIPLNANPYQLSVTFLHKFLSRYQPDVYSSIKKFLKRVDESPTNSIGIAFGSEGGAAATVATLASLGKKSLNIWIHSVSEDKISLQVLAQGRGSSQSMLTDS